MYYLLNNYFIYQFNNIDDIIYYLCANILSISQSLNNFNIDKFLYSYTILKVNNNIIIKRFNAIKYQNMVVNMLNYVKDENKTLETKNNNDIIIRPKKEKQKIHKKHIIPKQVENQQKEYETIFSEVEPLTSIFNNAPLNDKMHQLDKYLNTPIDNYTEKSLNEFIKCVKQTIINESIYSTNIHYINDIIDMMPKFITKFKDNKELISKDIKELIILLNKRIEQYSVSTKDYIKQCNIKQKEREENKKSIYENNKKIYENIIGKLKEKNDVILNNIDQIEQSMDIPQSFKEMFYAYSTSDNINDFIKQFNYYVKEKHILNTLFNIFLE